MSKLRTWLLISLWMIAGTLGLTKFWYAAPEHFPSALAALGIDVIAWVNAHLSLDGEQGADVELVYILLVAFASVSIITWLGWLVFRRKRRSRYKSTS